jgi:hypothetical protein
MCVMVWMLDDYYGDVRTSHEHLHQGDELRLEGAFSRLSHTYACAFALVRTRTHTYMCNFTWYVNRMVVVVNMQHHHGLHHII